MQRGDAPLVIVVSGLPRAGTSLAMQMLGAGGVPLLCDALRPADAANPRGYFEWAPIRQIASQPERIAQAQGRAVKVISALLAALPRGPRYRVVFVERALDEVQASQRAMLAQRGQPADDVGESELARHLSRTRAWLDRAAGFTTCTIRHRDALERPRSVAAQLVAFLGPALAPLGVALDADAMAAAVDRSLWRQRPAAASGRSGPATR